MQIMSEWNWIETKRGKNLRPELDFWTNLKFIFIILFDFVRKFSGSIFWSKNHSEAFLGFDEPAANFQQSWENLKLQQLSQFLAASCQVSKNAACLGKYIFLNDLLSECADTKQTTTVGCQNKVRFDFTYGLWWLGEKCVNFLLGYALPHRQIWRVRIPN